MRILAVILVALLFLPGIVVYLILRPPRTLEEEYQRTLEEEALLQSLEDPPVCPGCGRRIKESWMVCPSCHTKLKKPCDQCHHLMELAWNVCPYCGTPAPGVRKRDQGLSDINQPTPDEEEAGLIENEAVTGKYAEFIHVVEPPEKPETSPGDG
jgi:RNA polymerase subunit RPABC4/transcription elongation factor Spt4